MGGRSSWGITCGGGFLVDWALKGDRDLEGDSALIGGGRGGSESSVGPCPWSFRITLWVVLTGSGDELFP